jgi:isocitrate dehydrogenase
MRPTIIYTKTDEAPALATYSLLPIVQAFTKHAGINIETRDISVAARILAAFADQLPAPPEGRRPPRRTRRADSQAGSQHHQAAQHLRLRPAAERSHRRVAGPWLRRAGLPRGAERPMPRRDTKARYDKVKGSAVNPVLREGNSDRRAPKAVKDYARAHPHSMGKWSPDSKTTVATMGRDDFFSNEKSLTLAAATTAKIEFVGADGTSKVLLPKLTLKAGEILDATVMRQAALEALLRNTDSQGQG